MTEGVRRRAERVDVRQAREALKLVIPINRRIGPWQAQAAKLSAYGQKLRSIGRHEPALQDEAETLLRVVAQQRRELSECISTLPPQIGRHSRMNDTLRALDSVTTGLTQAVKLLEV